MEELKSLLAALMVYHTNMKVIHWNIHGNGFDRIHQTITNEYAEHIYGDIDITAEFLLRMGNSALDYLSAIKTLKDSSIADVLVIARDNESFDQDKAFKIIDTMLGNICKLIENALGSDEMHEPENVSIKASLESMHGYYDVQYRFLNSRRMD